MSLVKEGIVWSDRGETRGYVEELVCGRILVLRLVWGPGK